MENNNLICLTVEDYDLIHSYFKDRKPNKAELIDFLRNATVEPDIEYTRTDIDEFIKKIESLSDKDFANLEYKSF